jgi:hypothetical protein
MLIDADISLLVAIKITVETGSRSYHRTVMCAEVIFQILTATRIKMVLSSEILRRVVW